MLRAITWTLLIMAIMASPTLAADSAPTGSFAVNLGNALIVYVVGIIVSFATAFGIKLMGQIIRRFNISN